MCDDIKIINIIEWLIVLSLGIIGWYIAIRSSLSQQNKERYNNLVQDFHSFVYDFRYTFLEALLVESKDKYVVQNIVRQIKYIYFKAENLDSLVKDKKNKIYEKIKNEGENFIDSALLDPDIEYALISVKNSKQVEIQKKNFLQFADKFFNNCSSLTKFSTK